MSALFPFPLRVRVAALFLLPTLGPSGCRETPQAKAAELHKVAVAREKELARHLAVADADPTKTVEVAKWIMPPELREISGLALTSRGTVFTHDDNVGRISEIDPRTGILLKSWSLLGNQKGDFEAITIAGSDIYLLKSNGKLFRFKEAADGQQVPFTVYDTGLGRECEFESLAYEADSSRLVMVCKRSLNKKDPHELRIFWIPLPLGDRSAITGIRVPLDQVVGSNKWKNFHPSDVNIDPFTKNYIIVASREKGLVEVTPMSSLLWQPGPEMSGLSRPSSVGPQLLKEVMELSLEFRAPTVMWFLDGPGGAILR